MNLCPSKVGVVSVVLVAAPTTRVCSCPSRELNGSCGAPEGAFWKLKGVVFG